MTDGTHKSQDEKMMKNYMFMYFQNFSIFNIGKHKELAKKVFN